MLPINHLKKTLDRELGPANWEFNNNPVGDFFIVHHVGTGHIYKLQLISDAWTSHLWDGKQWVADCFLSSPLNGKPTPLETTNLLTGEKGWLSFATQELKDDFLSHAPLVEFPEREAE